MLEFPAWKVANQSDLELFEKMLDFRSTVFGIENIEYILYRVFHYSMSGVFNRYVNLFLSNVFLRFHPTKEPFETLREMTRGFITIVMSCQTDWGSELVTV